MDLLWITLTSWATFLYPQHLLCLTLDVLSLLKIHVSSFPYMGTQWQSVPPVFGDIGWGTEQWAEKAKVCPLSRSQPCLKSQTQPLSSSALDFLGSCLAPGSQEDKNPAWNNPSVGEEDLVGCGGKPAQELLSPTHLSIGGCLSQMTGWIRGRGGVSCQKKGRTENMRASSWWQRVGGRWE